MSLLKLAAILLFVFALIVATGGTFITGWNVWLCSGLLAWVLDSASIGGPITLTSRRDPT